MKRLGKQLIVELCECSADKIDSVESVQNAMLEAAKAAKATIVAHKFHQFSPQGASGAVIIAESHLAIHTWPEYGYCAIDIFTCGDLDNYLAVEVLKEKFESKNCVITEVQRGIPGSTSEVLAHKPAHV